MRLRTLAASSACLVMAGLIAPTVAHAAGSETLYVTKSALCSDSGNGTFAVPFCTIQAAAGAAVPGDVVLIGAGIFDEQVNITRSGTASQPIIFTGTTSSVGRLTSVRGTSAAPIANAFTVDASHIVIENLQAGFTTSDAILVDASSDVRIDMITGSQAGTLGAVGNVSSDVHVTGASTGVSVRRSRLVSATGALITVDGSAGGTIVSTNELLSSLSSAVLVSGAANTAVTSNTASEFCGPGIAVTGGATGTSVENNIVDDSQTPNAGASCPGGGIGDEVAVDATATASTVLDYNNVCTLHSNVTPYVWAGTSYQTAATLTSATGQGSHDNNSANCYYLIEGSPAIDSADSAAVGELPLDINGRARVDDPIAANTGAGTYAYYDRGDVEVQDPIVPVGGTLKLSASQAPIGGAITVTASASDTWGDSLSYGISFGDGTTTTSTTGVVTHSYAAAGTYPIYAVPMVNGASGSQEVGYTTVAVVAPAALTADLTISQSGALTVAATGEGTTDAWNIVGYTFDFGDGSPATTATSVSGTQHTYAKPGTYTVTETITDSGGNSATKTTTLTTAGSDYTAYGPTRILDTRNGTGAARAKVSRGGVLKLKITGNGSIPSTGITAVALNVTATDATTGGYVTAYPDGQSTPGTSNVNFNAGQTVPNSVVVQVGADGYVDLYFGAAAAGSVDLIADVTGYFTQTAASGYTALSPARLLDTRNGTGTGGTAKAKLPAGKSLGLTIAGADGGSLPASGITAVALNVTVTNPTNAGFLTAYPDGRTVPNASNLNFGAGQTVANTVIVPVGADGKIDLYYGGPATGSVDLVADVSGYYSASGSGAYVPLAPMRILDTRTQGGPIARNGQADASAYNDPALGALGLIKPTGFVFNLTVTQPTAAGFITAYPNGESLPNVSSVNFGPGQTVANLGLISDGTYDYVLFHNSSAGTVQLIVDLFGYYANS